MKATKMLTLKKTSVLTTSVLIMLLACQQETEILNSVDTQNVNSEAASAAYINENSDISSIVMSNLTVGQYVGARIETDTVSNWGAIDGRLKCAKVKVVGSGDKIVPAGTITIDYDAVAGCADDDNITRKGKIIITYRGKRWQPGSTFSIQLVNFYRNSVHVEGGEYDTTKLSVDSLHLQFVSSLVGGKITFGDGRSIERDHSFRKTWYRSLNPAEPANDEWHIEGSSWGKNKNGNAYVMQIGIPSDSNPSVLLPAPLIHRFLCWSKYKIGIPVKGIKIITVTSGNDMKAYKVDYGDATCDNLVTVTINGKEKAISVNGDGN